MGLAPAGMNALDIEEMDEGQDEYSDADEHEEGRRHEARVQAAARPPFEPGHAASEAEAGTHGADGDPEFVGGGQEGYRFAWLTGLAPATIDQPPN